MNAGKLCKFHYGAIALAVSLLFQPQPLLAQQPTGAQVVSGTVSMVKPNATTLNVTNTPGAIINWQGFSIGAGETTRFIQQSSSSAVLNRVVGADISAINGQLLSNGRVFLINPAGIIIGPSGSIDTAGFVGSTLNMQNADFLAGKLRFSGDATSGAIINQGWIRTSYGGNVLLVAPRIENSGLIQTPGGELILAAGQKVTVSSLDQEGVQFEVQAPTDSVVNVGQLLAAGGAVGVFAGSIKHSGDIRANALVRDEGGRIVLKASGNVTLASGSSIQADGKAGGAITVQSQSGTTLVSGEVSATGSEGKGGDIRLLGNRVRVIDNAVIDASGERGGGQVLVGGDYQGKNPDVQNAARTVIGPDATLRADAIREGDGGKVIVWSDEVTRVYGAISVRGGAQSGNGGFIETSGKQDLTVGDSTRVDMSAPAGQGGTWLLDPHNIFVQTGGGALTIDVDQFADTPASDQTISSATIAGVSSGTVILQANNDITFVDPVTLSAGVGLTAQAGRSILVNADIIASNANIRLTANELVALGVLAANRDAGAASLIMAPGITVAATGTGNVFLRINDGTGHDQTTGNLVVANVIGANVSIIHEGITANSAVQRAGASSLITGASSVFMELETAAGAAASIGTAAAPMRVTTSNLDAHYHNASGGIFIDSPTQGVTIGGSLGATGLLVQGVQTISGGPISLTVNGALTQHNGLPAFCGTGGGSGGPICAGGSAVLGAADILTLTANNMNLQRAVRGSSVSLQTAGTATLNSTEALNNFFGGTTATVNGAFASNQPITFTNAGLTANFNGSANLSGSLTFNSGTANFNASSAISNFFLINGNVNLNAPVTISNPASIQGGTLAGTGVLTFSNNLNLQGGTLGGSGAVTINTQLIWSGGTIANTNASGVTATNNVFISSGTETLTGNLSTGALSMSGGAFTVGNGGLFTLTGSSSSVISGGTVSDSGTIRLNGTGGLRINNPGALTINAGGLLNFASDASVLAPSGTPVFTNNGTVRKSAGSGTSQISNISQPLAFINTGLVDVQSGTLLVGSGFPVNAGTINVAAGKTFSTAGNNLTNNGSITGVGTISLGTGTLTNNGIIGPGNSPGTLTVFGNLTLNPSSILNIELQAPGTIAGSDYDVLNVTGAANLGGTLNVSHLGGFAPTVGQNFSIMNYASRSGDFATQNAPGGFTYAGTPDVAQYSIQVSSVPSNALTAATVTNVVVADRNRMREAVPDDEAEPESKTRLTAPQCI